MHWRKVIIIIVCALLGACFTSDEPLIDVNNTDIPFINIGLETIDDKGKPFLLQLRNNGSGYTIGWPLTKIDFESPILGIVAINAVVKQIRKEIYLLQIMVPLDESKKLTYGYFLIMYKLGQEVILYNCESFPESLTASLNITSKSINAGGKLISACLIKNAEQVKKLSEVLPLSSDAKKVQHFRVVAQE